MKRLVWGLLFGLVLIGSLVLNSLLYQRSRTYYQRTLGLQLDPLGLGYFPNKSPVPRAKDAQQVVLFYGDSRAAEWANPELPGVQVINRGIHGQTTRQILDRYEIDVAPHPMDVLVLQAGVNDLKSIPLFPERRGVIVEDCLANLTAIAELGKRDGARVVVSTVFPVGPPSLSYRPVWSSAVAEAVAEVNEGLRAMEGVVLLEAGVLANDAGGLRDELRRDHLHLKPAGYTALNELLIPLLKAP